MDNKKHLNEISEFLSTAPMHSIATLLLRIANHYDAHFISGDNIIIYHTYYTKF